MADPRQYSWTTYLQERQVAWQVKYASGKVLGIVLSMPPLNFSFRSWNIIGKN